MDRLKPGARRHNDTVIARPLIAALPSASADASGWLSLRRRAEPLDGAQKFVGSSGRESAGVGGAEPL